MNQLRTQLSANTLTYKNFNRLSHIETRSDLAESANTVSPASTDIS